MTALDWDTCIRGSDSGSPMGWAVRAACRDTQDPDLFFAADDSEDWRDRALCAETDPEAFFPDKGESSRPAKQVCSRCPVSTECLEYALGAGEEFGVWGGKSPMERRSQRRAQRREVAAA